MLLVNNVSMQFGSRTLFKEVNLKFQKENCYGIIGANGAGKSTFLKIINEELKHHNGTVKLTEKERLTNLKQKHYHYID